MEYHPACVYDRLVIRDGPLHSSSVIANLCGQHHSNVYLSTSNAILLEFHSDHIIPAAGFKMTVETGDYQKKFSYFILKITLKYGVFFKTSNKIELNRLISTLTKYLPQPSS